MAHNSLGSSQVDRLTATASVVYLRPNQAARTTSSHPEEVKIPFTHVQRVHLAFMVLLHGLWSFKTWKTPFLDTCTHMLSNYEALIIYLQHIEAVRSTLSRKNCIVTQAAVAESLFTLQAGRRIPLPYWLSVRSLKSIQEWNITLFQDKATWHNTPHPYEVTLVVFCKHCTNKHRTHKF